MLKVEVDRAKKLARRISSKHFRNPVQQSVDHSPLPQNGTAIHANQVANTHNRAAKQYNLAPAVDSSSVPDLVQTDFVKAAVNQQIRELDQGVFSLNLIRHEIYPRDLSERPQAVNAPEIQQATYSGTKRAVTQAYNRIENRYTTYFDAVNFEPSLPQDRHVKERYDLYQWELPSPNSNLSFPPHLASVPPQVRVNQFFGPNHLFNHMRLLDTASILPRIIPETFLNWLHDSPESNTFKGIEDRELALRKKNADIYTVDDIVCRPNRDWYTDAVFAQQQFTGTNPTTLTQASAAWISAFRDAARQQKNGPVVDFFKTATKDSFYIQDASYFREAIKIANDARIETEHKNEQERRFLGATTTLFNLGAQGALHPLAIVVDYKGSMADSVVIFNKRLRASDSTCSEATDWPWRYAKMCAQTADWHRHELTIHLTNAHLVEEACIVACSRILPSSHVLYELLQPHWFKTLSLNAAARKTLVPSVIVPIAGMSKDSIYAFIRHAYSTFDWSALNVPTDLTHRGFPVSEINSSPKYHNYAYGRDILLVWEVLYKFVLSVLELTYPNDATVANDTYVQQLAQEIRSEKGGQLASFPELKTVKMLANAVTMMIHIASPQHTAVNYTQDYYQSFLPNKPTALCTPLPETFDALKAYQEKDLIAALPVHRPREWLLATHLPHLLSYRVAEDKNLINYALSLAKEAYHNGQMDLAKAAAQLWQDLIDCGKKVAEISKEMDDQTKPYDVLMPEATAVSIFI